MDKIISGWARAKILFLGLAKAKIATREKALCSHTLFIVRIFKAICFHLESLSYNVLSTLLFCSR